MRTIPFGYRIEDGVVVIDEKDGEDVKRIFQLYLEGFVKRELREFFGKNPEMCSAI